MTKFIIIQILGIIIICFEILIIKGKNKNKVLIYNTLANTVCLIQYYIMSAYSGLLSILVAFIRNIVFNHYDKEKKKAPLIWLILILAFLIGAQYASYNGIVSIIPLINTSIYTYGLWQNDIKRFKIINTITYIASTFFYLYYGAYTNAISDLVFAIICIIDLKNFKPQKKRKKKRK